MERIIEFSPAWDKRNTAPSKNFGIHCVWVRMVLKGAEGAVQFYFGTGMFLPETHKEWLSQFDNRGDVPYMGYDLGYHSPKPMYEGQEPMPRACELLGGKQCFYDGSGLAAEKLMDLFVRKGTEAVWKKLEKYYKDTFNQNN